MSCAYPEERIALFVEGDLPARQAQDVERHLQGCAECRESANSFRESVAELKALAHPGALADEFENVHWRVAEALHTTNASPRLTWLRLRVERFLFAGLRSREALAGAAFVLAIGLAVALPWRSSPPEHSLFPPVTGAANTSLGESVAVNLEPPVVAGPVGPVGPVVPGAVASTNALAAPAVAAEPPVAPAVAASPVPLMVKMLTDDPNVVIYWFVEQGGSDVSSF